MLKIMKGAARFRDELAAIRSEDAANRKSLDPNS